MVRAILRSAAALLLVAATTVVGVFGQAGPAGAAPKAAVATTYTKTVRYGSSTIPAATDMEMGHLDNGPQPVGEQAVLQLHDLGVAVPVRPDL